MSDSWQISYRRRGRTRFHACAIHPEYGTLYQCARSMHKVRLAIAKVMNAYENGFLQPEPEEGFHSLGIRLGFISSPSDSPPPTPPKDQP